MTARWPGRPRRPDQLHAGKGYSSRADRQALRARDITPRIARPGIESSQRLGRYRWVVERTLAWLGKYRRLVIRWERRADIHLAFLDLGCALICFNVWQQNQRVSRRQQMRAAARLRKASWILLGRRSVVRGAASPGGCPSAADDQGKGETYLSPFSA